MAKVEYTFVFFAQCPTTPPQRTGGNSAHTKDYNVTLFPYSASGVFNMLKKESKNITLSYEEWVVKFEILKNQLLNFNEGASKDLIKAPLVSTSKGVLACTTRQLCLLDLDNNDVSLLCQLPSSTDTDNVTNYGTSVIISNSFSVNKIVEFNGRILYAASVAINTTRKGIIGIYELIENSGVYKFQFKTLVNTGNNSDAYLSFVEIGGKLFAMNNNAALTKCNFYEVVFGSDGSISLNKVSTYDTSGNEYEVNRVAWESNNYDGASIKYDTIDDKTVVAALVRSNTYDSESDTSIYTISLSEDGKLLFNPLMTSTNLVVMGFEYSNTDIYMYSYTYDPSTGNVEIEKTNINNSTKTTLFNKSIEFDSVRPEDDEIITSNIDGTFILYWYKYESSGSKYITTCIGYKE